jgi:hypothetical protein
MLFDAVNFLQDRTYPFACASGITPGDGQLHDLFRRAGNSRDRQQKKER